ncbi:MAG: outer membrane protein assembly factor BamD [Bryobacteraceae bacterium]|nr:outer membrane protein assembly factor BamD [Bryobacteraceae bacterium]
MQLYKPAFVALLVVPSMFGASREMIEIQRSVGQLQEQVSQLQRTVDERIGALTTLMQQALDTSTKTNTSVAVLESGLRDRLSQQLSAPITGVSTKVDQMSTDFAGVRENVSAMNETLTKVQAQLIDLSNSVKILQPPAAPPPVELPGQLSPGASASGLPSAPPAGLSAKQLYDSAMRDRSAGNSDLALQGLGEYLKWFGTSELAPAAQFNIGQIYYDKADYPGAIKSFDAVLERFTENNKTPDAMYMKGMSLFKAGQRNQAAQEFLNVIQKYPTSEVATKARTLRKSMGLSSPTDSSAAPRAPARRRR